MKKHEIHHPHDSLFKKAFKDKEVAIDFLKNRLSSEVLADIDLNTLAVEDSSYVADNLRASYSDLVLSANIKGTKGYIYTLVELQTQNDGTIVLRLLKYNIQLMEDHLKQGRGKKLPPIINLVMYAGKTPYKGDERIIDAFQDPEHYLKTLNSIFLINLGKQTEAQILEDGKAGAIELVIRQGVKRDFKKMLKNISFMALLNTSPYRKEVVYYILNRDKHDPMEVLEEMDKLDEKLKQEIMSGLQRVIKQREEQGILLGIKKGKAEGKAEGIQIGEQKGKAEGVKLGISAILDLARQGYIDQAIADKILKEKFKI